MSRTTQNTFDVLIVGAGVAGCTLAYALSTLPKGDSSSSSSSKQLRIGVIERSLDEPDRIVGELLQPGGVMALQKLGMEGCLEGIDAVPTRGYCVVERGRSVHIPYPGGHEGRSFHHGRFIMRLREKATSGRGVVMLEGTVNDLVEDSTDGSGRVVGVSATLKGKDTKEEFYAPLVIVADGCFSNFRTKVMGSKACVPVTKSHFVGVVLEDATLPYKYHGTVCLTESAGPVLLYQIGTRDTRMLVDVSTPLPADLTEHIRTKVVPQLPSSLHLTITTALTKDRLRRMPNSFLPPVLQGQTTSNTLTSAKKGVFLVGDAWNMRHPLTGGGMTVAFADVVILRDLLAEVPGLDFGNWEELKEVLRRWHWKRKPLSATVNVLSVALYDLFGADDEDLEVLRTGCFKYFELGGECVNGPVNLLSAIKPSFPTLFYHFFAVAVYSIWVMFTHPRLVQRYPNEKPQLVTPRVDQYPLLTFKAISVFWKAVFVFTPLLWSEIRWWSPDDKAARRRSLLLGLGVPVVMAGAAAAVGLGLVRVSI